MIAPARGWEIFWWFMVVLNVAGLVLGFASVTPGLIAIHSLGMWGGFSFAMACRQQRIERAIKAPEPVKEIETKHEVVLSVPAKKVNEAFLSIPESYRPVADIRPVVEALDVKYGISRANDAHMVLVESRDSFYRGFRFTWDADGVKNCPEYREMYDEFVEMRLAVEKREHALAVAERKHDLDSIESVMLASRNQREAISESLEALERI